MNLGPRPSEGLRIERADANLCPLDELRQLQRGCFPRSSIDLTEELQRPWAEVWLAYDGALVGYLLAWRVADELQILEVGTSAAERRRGVGRALVRSSVDQASKQGTRIVLLEVRRTNGAALALYRSLGFKTWSLRKGYYDDGGEDAVELALSFREDGTPAPLDDEFCLDDPPPRAG